jgi:glycosyltransferase involved in cell wall biosynthesis
MSENHHRAAGSTATPAPAMVPRGPRIVFVTQTLDPADPVLGFVASWVRALAERSDRLAVIANEVHEAPPDLGAGVTSLGKEKGAGRLLRGLKYQSALTRTFSEVKPDVLVAHMCPVYLNLGYPLSLIFGVRTILWFAHPADHAGLRLAERLADVVVTSFPGAYPRRNGKVRVIGQGIDTRMFSCSPGRSNDGPLRLLALGRTSPSKDLTTAIEAMSLLRESGVAVNLRIVGPSTTPAEIQHRVELESLVSSLRLDDCVVIESEVPYFQVPGLYRDSEVLINTTVSGSGDKVVLEAMASGKPVVVSNPALGPLLNGQSLRMQFREGDPSGLAACISEMAAAGPRKREELGRSLCARIESDHSVDHWAESITRIATELNGKTGKPR